MILKSPTIYIFFFLIFACALLLEASNNGGGGFKLPEREDPHIQRSDFPPGFLFGAVSSAYQIEGAYLADGKSFSNWDVFCHSVGCGENGEDGDIADDHYHHFLEDIEMIHSLGIKVYRFSISWARILPRGRFGEVNPAGIMFYNKIIDNLLLKGIEPFVTLSHGDFPQELEDRYGSWLNAEMREDFVHMAEICFNSFGGRVKYWITINEPNLVTEFAYETGIFPPSRCSKPFGNCLAGNSDVEPPIVMHNMLLAHGMAVKLYRDKFQGKQGGSIGLTVHCPMLEPLTDSELDRNATKRAFAFKIGWPFDPLIFGDYPEEMHEYLGSDLPSFSLDEKKLMTNSIDFIAINHYTTLYTKDCTNSSCSPTANRAIKGFLDTTGERDGVAIGELTGLGGIYVVPRGMEEIVNFIKTRYNNTPMMITENGYSSPDVLEERIDGFVNDTKRVEFHTAYLASLAKAIRGGADVRGYFVWSLMDNYEWLQGYKLRFGLHHVDRQTLTRTPKLSARWYKNFLTNSSDLIGSGSGDNCKNRKTEEHPGNPSSFARGFNSSPINPSRKPDFQDGFPTKYSIDGGIYLEDAKSLNSWEVFALIAQHTYQIGIIFKIALRSFLPTKATAMIVNGNSKLLSLLFFFFIFLGLFLVDSTSINGDDVKKSDFPNGFLFGVSTSSYQIEGAYLEDGKSLNNWDAFAMNPGNVRNGDNGFVADDHYHQYLKDIEIIQSLGVDAYRFSISWARVLPRGRFGEVNPNGILFYNKILDNLLLRGIKPFVTIYHHDFPQELQDRYGSWLSPLMQEDYVYFAKTCFKNFGDRVKHWTTINEPNLFTQLAYMNGKYPPARCSPPFGNCSAGNSDIEPIIVMHNLLLAHGKAVKLYRKDYQREQGGSVGIVVDCLMYEPLTDDDLDREAANRGLAFSIGWALDPLILGDYPSEMRQYLGNQLPRFSNAENKFMANSIDYIAVNHYSTAYAKDCIHSSCSLTANRPINGFVDVTRERNGVRIGEPTGISMLPVVPRGIGEMIGYLKKRYNKPMFITENGYSEPKMQEVQVKDIQQDFKRIEFHKMYLSSLAQAIRDGADVRGYFVWTLMDDFEWILGYSVRFGLYYIDRQTLARIPKLSARWYQDFLKNDTRAPAIRISNLAHKQTYS